ncbi:uncharacterized protein LOC107628471 isoform X1 [Arachis ipaensis]|uniref:Uncharacterized protein n=1 Tax=Arachis hypogaea TaxID=3818 RepID=A0A445ARM9_ARAHY|nr:uncharacterized protein LOC107628471 isoform X1 [Arachis ipaensis]XP_016186621.1 uncharacterized protein LOC107628471 isoform X1 [Arachis ipaensis]XP_020975576.1 uncharacterized protein LOC107628471 isoform X1 [Arachis ipaensis]XP_020975580.1 uncharacterized protein LOC107628471 isoform X1 [Arachis ipaensis]XP_020975587.1 uncharacterized protein LOC107628471 isoform X1 [Arachis ipaensis]XP_020975589.1 uncharacterized protein LOC107628471 isoform X1 [Arachis ipaensis]XP_025627319.1 uncharac
MAAPFFSTPFQPYVYQSPQDAITPFQILGGEAQVVQIMLKPQEKIIAKPGSMCFMSGSIEMENSYLPENEVGIWQWLFGKNISSIFLRNSGQSDGFVGIAAPYFARILPIDLARFNGEILCQPDAFLCSVNDVKVVNTIDQRGRNIVAGAENLALPSSKKSPSHLASTTTAARSGTLSPSVALRSFLFVLSACSKSRTPVRSTDRSFFLEGFLRQKISGQGLAFILAGGSVLQKNLESGEVLAVDVSCIVAVTSTVNVQIKYNGPPRRTMFGGDNAVTALLTGPGIVFIQSLPFHRLSQRIARSVTSPNMRENPKFLIQIAIFFFLAYVVIVSSLILTDV